MQTQTRQTKSKPINLKIDLIPAQKQNVWHGFAVLNFTFGGAGAGLYLVSALLEVLTPKALTDLTFSILRLAAGGLVGLGLIAVALEAGRPTRARYLLGNLLHSWMSRETLSAMVFIPAAIVSAYSAQPILIGVAVLSGAMFIVAQALVLYRCRAVAAWNVPVLPALMFTSALTGGCGLLLIARPSTETATTVCAVIVSLCSSAGLFCYALYLYWPVEEATVPLRNNQSLFWVVGIGRALPTLAFLSGCFSKPISTFALTISGIALFAASWIEKDRIIRYGGYLTPVSLRLRLATTDPRLQSKRSIPHFAVAAPAPLRARPASRI